jgi:hypothetical protein
MTKQVIRQILPTTEDVPSALALVGQQRAAILRPPDGIRHLSSQLLLYFVEVGLDFNNLEIQHHC